MLFTGFSTLQLYTSSSAIRTRVMVRSFRSGDSWNRVSLVRGFPPLNHRYVVLVPFSWEQLRTTFSLSSSTEEDSVSTKGLEMDSVEDQERVQDLEGGRGGPTYRPR